MRFSSTKLKNISPPVDVAKTALFPDGQSKWRFVYRNRFDFALFIICLVGLLTIVSFRLTLGNSKVDLQGSPYKSAFSEPKYIMWAVVCALSVAVTTGIETALDFFLETSSILKFDIFQRFFMFLIPVIPGFILLTAEESKNLPYLFAFCYAAQCVGCPAPLLSLCHQLFPRHFTEMKMLVCYGFWTASCILTLLAFFGSNTILGFSLLLAFFCFVNFNTWMGFDKLGHICIRTTKKKGKRTSITNCH